MVYRVVITDDAEVDLDNFVRYLDILGSSIKWNYIRINYKEKAPERHRTDAFLPFYTT